MSNSEVSQPCQWYDSPFSLDAMVGSCSNCRALLDRVDIVGAGIR